MGEHHEPAEDCMRCGACCFSESPRHARVTGDDHARLGEEAEELVTWIENGAFMRLAPLELAPAGLRRCAALELDPEAGTFACSIYERRPQVCRDLERASGACRGELEAKGERPRSALLVLTARARAAPR